MPLKICCKNIVKIVCTYHFLKKKKVECGNGIAEIGGEIFFFFKKLYVHTIFTIFLQQILSGMLLLLD